MGLDMYLHAKKYVEKVNWQALRDNEELSYESPEVINHLLTICLTSRRCG